MWRLAFLVAALVAISGPASAKAVWWTQDLQTGSCKLVHTQDFPITTSGMQAFIAKNPKMGIGLEGQDGDPIDITIQYPNSDQVIYYFQSESSCENSRYTKRFNSPKIIPVIPPDCQSAKAINMFYANIPGILGLGPDDIHIVNIQSIAQIPSMEWTVTQTDTPLYMLSCPLNVKWSNGLEQYGWWFEVYQNQYGQVMVSYSQQQITPNY